MEKEKMSKTSKTRRETAVQGTNDSSIVSKCSMAAHGYFDDPYLQRFVSKVTRRAPLIHRGYYIRAKTIDYIMKKFLERNQGSKQIISLGAGFDSTYFRLHSQDLLQDTVFCEVDFPEVLKRKRALIEENPEMCAMIGETFSDIEQKSPHIEMWSKSYKLLGVDLSQTNTMEAALKLCDLDFDNPTLLVSECVLTYMTRRTASGVVKWASETFANSVFVLYEQINPADSFGLFMQRHYHNVGSPLKCINYFPTVQSQRDRFLKLGWRSLEVMDMNEFYNNLLPRAERDRVEMLEMFDEYEELHLKCAHYMVLLGYHGNGNHLLKGMMHLKDNTKTGIEKYKGLIRVSTPVINHLLKRFGHVTCLQETRQALCVGGFGEQVGKHMRVTDFVLVDLETMQTNVINMNVDNKKIEVSRMHATVSRLKDGRLFLIGGRLSPMRLCTQLVAMELNPRKFRSDVSRQTMNCDHTNKCVNCGRCTDENKEEKSGPDMNNLKTDYNNSYKTKTEADLNCGGMNISEVTSAMNMACGIQQEENQLTNPGCLKINDSGEIVPANCASSAIGEAGDTKIESNVQGATSGQPDVVRMGQLNSVNSESSEPVKSTSRDEAETCGDVVCTVMEQTGDIPSPRWRHTTVVYENDDGTEALVVYGGRSQNVLALGDCHKFIPVTQYWHKIAMSGKEPEPRQSHSACIWNKHMVVAGGLNADLQPLASVHLLNLDTYTWTQLKSEVNPRYSHTAHVFGDILVLIGGVSFSHDVPGVCMIHLPSGSSAEFTLPDVDKDNLLMLHRHTSVVIDNDRIMLLGGGGNCFSFGTHLNSSPIIMDLSAALRTMKQIVDSD